MSTIFIFYVYGLAPNGARRRRDTVFFTIYAFL